ncbi:peptidase [Sulfolobus sp. A20]|uniref:type 1 glutamine amidotransferase domain-containing protein n=2 Tax=Sulfolobaceae TaxID=118883 RepID=UPI0008460F51|nr:type 1 glutamine amidotransferase domain-containing protein [Sulfolobus sp. A20]TRM76174.1 type 1 glutamine amidotransferase [Sulfolobus sp. E5]TRM79230.1 type 1 glutamine amidotransferase [Sulfolobus sp. B5]TRM79866.1 type 1 glutamine amidotransferase [Sulfolobus sp. D5]TRM84816.1 type 1 glutamine amidotransferase [Sulfolobus sp. F3]TRM85954.1 type 1 glutamine amidotransferase [Sulfolobus sp. E3]TRM88929.1 type 1 glutamine amidotransferase [Sulfolobus sp. C3]TRM93079.1 type 1 glutamine a
MSNQKKVLFLVGEEFEDIEVLYPFYRVIEEGFQPVIAWKETNAKVTGKHGYTLVSDISFKEVRPEDYVALVLPGGRGPERIRTIEEVKNITRAFFELKKPVAAICHGPQILISANLVKGRKLTSVVSIKDDVIAAGGIYIDDKVVVDDNLISSRNPSDLPYFTSTLIKALKSLK